MIAKNKIVLAMLTLLVCVLACGIPVALAQQSMPAAPQPTVPELFTIEGQFVRVAYNNEGFATLGYRTAQGSVGGDWILLDVGITQLKGTADYTLKRDNLTLKIPDGSTVALATQADFNKAGNCRNLVMQDNRINDSISYFPNTANNACAIKFFAQPGTLAYDQVELSYNRACLGRLFFKIPGGIVTGQYWLNIQFANSVVQVPFRILTKEEAKEFSKKWEDIKKAHDEAMKQ